MENKDVDVLSTLVKFIIDDYSMFTQGAITTQLIIVNAMIESGAMDKGVLKKEVENAMGALTAPQKATTFPSALIQLANLLGLEAPRTAAAESWDEATRLIDRIRRQ